MSTSTPSGHIPDPRFDEKRRLFAAVDQFALQMKAALMHKIDAGYTGWDDPRALPLEEMHRRLLDCATKAPLAVGQEADCANYALFLWWQRTHPVPAITPAQEKP